MGAEGPATIRDTVLGAGSRVDAGYLEGAVLLAGARAGWGAHFRPGTLLEEQASTAHAVGLKQTILLAFVTLGSLINFCDVLMAGGTSRSDHSEVGSGFIHFNYTPWGAKGDKATPSLIGDVTRGVFLRAARIFLGGAGGLVGPGRVGYGSITGAGQVVRRDVGEECLTLSPNRKIEVNRRPGHLDPLEPRRTKNLEFLGQLAALRRWYRDVRLARVPAGRDGRDDERIVLQAALETIELCIEERRKRLDAFSSERGAPPIELDLEAGDPCPLEVRPSDEDHLSWVRGLDDEQVEQGSRWLTSIASVCVAQTRKA